MHHHIYSYALHKLEQPYTDDCINYARMEFSSRLNAISTCINEYTMKYSNILHESKVFSKNDTKYLNYSITKKIYNSSSKMNYSTVCESRYQKFDCFHSVSFTQYERHEYNN